MIALAGGEPARELMVALLDQVAEIVVLRERTEELQRQAGRDAANRHPPVRMSFASPRGNTLIGGSSAVRGYARSCEASRFWVVNARDRNAWSSRSSSSGRRLALR